MNAITSPAEAVKSAAPGIAKAVLCLKTGVESVWRIRQIPAVAVLPNPVTVTAPVRS